MLMATGRELQKLIECLFDTRIYASIESYFTDYAKHCKEGYHKQRDQLTGLLQSENWPTTAAGKTEIEAIKTNLSALKNIFLK